MEPGRSLGVMGILTVLIVLTDVNNRQLPELGHIHRFVQEALAQGAIAKEADGHLIGSAQFYGHACARGYA